MRIPAGTLTPATPTSRPPPRRQAHLEIRKAMLNKYGAAKTPLLETPEGFMLEEDGQPVDGGSTATVVALLQGHLLVVANVGDSVRRAPNSKPPNSKHRSAAGGCDRAAHVTEQLAVR